MINHDDVCGCAASVYVGVSVYELQTVCFLPAYSIACKLFIKIPFIKYKALKVIRANFYDIFLLYPVTKPVCVFCCAIEAK